MPQPQNLGLPYLSQPRRVACHRPRAALPASGQAPIFTVRGGPIRPVALVGKVTTAGDATATNLKATANPASGATDVDIASNLAVANLAAGTLIGPQANGIGSALTAGGAIVGLANGPTVDVGTIDLVTSATNPLQAEWFLVYDALHPAARVSPVLPGATPGLRSRPLPALPQLVHRSATALPQTAQSPLFRVKTGPIRLLALWGEVQSPFGAVATNLTIVGNPDSGLTDVNLCTATAVANLAAGILLGLQVNGVGSALQAAGALVGLDNPVIVDAGTIDWLTSASNTGTADWYALWEPVHPAARLVAA